MYIDEDLDDEAEREAARRGTTKAALIRRGLRAELGWRPRRDPIDDLVGASLADPAESIDSVVYGG